MPLKKGKKNIGYDVKEMEKSGHSKKVSVAAALHTVLDKPKKKMKSKDHKMVEVKGMKTLRGIRR